MNEINPYETPTACLADPVDPEALELADRGTRLGAKLLDYLIGPVAIGILSAILIPALLHERKLAGAGQGLSVLLGVSGLLMVAGALTLLGLNLTWLHTRG